MMTIGNVLASKENQPQPVYWCGELKDECNICESSFGNVMYDAKTHRGPWANMCEFCWQRFSHLVLGVGFGQKYELQADGRWLKTGG